MKVMMLVQKILITLKRKLRKEEDLTLFVTLICCMVTAFFNNAMFMEDTNIWQPILFFSFLRLKARLIYVTPQIDGLNSIN